MSKIAYKIEDNVVANIILIPDDASYEDFDAIGPVDGVSIGWTVNEDGTYTAPPVLVKKDIITYDEEEITEEMIDEIIANL
jgi:hypothetical protein